MTTLSEILPPPSVAWRPRTSAKQDQIRWLCSPQNPAKKKFICISGPRKSAKTIGCLHAIAQMAWETDRGCIAMVTPSVTAGSDAGPWQQLATVVIPEWIGGDFGMEWAGVSAKKGGSYQEGVSKKLKMVVTNKWGNTSSIQLESMKEGELEIGKRFRGKNFTAVYWADVGVWVKNRTSFDLLIEVLRGSPHLVQKDYTLLIDTNPADEGERHWLYQLFYAFRLMDEGALHLMAQERGLDGPVLLGLQEQLELMEIFVHDNPYLTVKDLALLKAQYAHSPDMWNRYYLGKWTTATGESLFHDVFKPSLHVIGEIETPANPTPEELVPEEATHELYTGWDMGYSNTGTVLIEKFWKDDKNGVGLPAFKVLDEGVFLKTDLSIGDVTEIILRKMRRLDEAGGKSYRWAHFSDRSAFDAREPISDRYHFEEVNLASHGEIWLQGVARKHGSVHFRVDLLRKLLHQGRIFFNNDRCPMCIQMLQSLRPGKDGAAVDKKSQHKHVFDALTYALSALCFEELQKAINQDINTNRTKGSGGGIISVPL